MNASNINTCVVLQTLEKISRIENEIKYLENTMLQPNGITTENITKLNSIDCWMLQLKDSLEYKKSEYDIHISIIK